MPQLLEDRWKWAEKEAKERQKQDWNKLSKRAKEKGMEPIDLYLEEQRKILYSICESRKNDPVFLAILKSLESVSKISEKNKEEGK